MGRLKVKCTLSAYDASKDPESNVNQLLASKLIAQIEKIPGGKALLSDALAAGDIIIDLTMFHASSPLGAHWDAKAREIPIVIPYIDDINALSTELPATPSQDPVILYKQKLQHGILLSALFELCNAANPLLQVSDEGKLVLQYPTAESYAKDREFCEFKSHQRRVQLVNAAVAELKWPQGIAMREYADNEFERYYQDVSNDELPIYGEYKTHANFYRESYRNAYDIVRDGIIRIFVDSYAYPALPSIPANLNPDKGIELYENIDLVKQVISVRTEEDLDAINIEALEKLDTKEMSGLARAMDDHYKASINAIEICMDRLKVNITNAKSGLQAIREFKSKLCKEIIDRLKIDDVISMIEKSIKEKETMIRMYEEMKPGLVRGLKIMKGLEISEPILSLYKQSLPGMFAIKGAMEKTRKSLEDIDRNIQDIKKKSRDPSE